MPSKAIFDSWRALEIKRTYMTLTEVEAVFVHSNQNWHCVRFNTKKQHRTNDQLFISVLTYQAVCTLRTQIKSNGFYDSWTTIRNALDTIIRTTMSFECRNGLTLHVRKSAAEDAARLQFTLLWASLRHSEFRAVLNQNLSHCLLKIG